MKRTALCYLHSCIFRDRYVQFDVVEIASVFEFTADSPFPV